MRNLKMKGLLGTLLIGAMIMGQAVPAMAANEVPQVENFAEGFKGIEGIEIPEQDMEEIPEATEYVKSFSRGAHITASNSYYGKYSCDYTYNRMSAPQRELYDRLYQVCEAYLTGADDFGSYGSSSITPKVSYAGLSDTEAQHLVFVFNTLNPQFYFLGSQYLYSTSSSEIALVCYGNFASGATRSATTAQLFSKVDGIVSQLNAYSSAYDKAKAANDYLCNTVVYRSNSMDQSCYSALMNGQSVCAGYSEAYELIMNAAGVDTVAVTSLPHEWNEVYIDGHWYVVDVTYADQESWIWYDYFCKSDATVNACDEGDGSHVPEDIWSTYARPTCDYDWGTAPVLTQGASGSMYRLYNPNTSEHLYTQDFNETSTLSQIGWKYEGIAWEAPTTSAIPVYRLYNPNSGEHHYTKDANEYNTLQSMGWSGEGVKFYSAGENGTTMYRLFNPNAIGQYEAGAHHYTKDLNERNTLVAAGWRDEGIAWYGN